MTQTQRPGEAYLAQDFRDVDAAAVGKLVTCLRYMDALPEFQRYKASITKALHLRAGAVTADLGCGLGLDVQRCAQWVVPGGRAIGVDASLKLLELARAANTSPAAEFLHADIQNLPFADGFLHSCKIDRTLQHIEQPIVVLREAFRTVRSKGIVICAEPDWSTFNIEISANDSRNQAIAMQIAETWRKGIRNPSIGREVPMLLQEAGFVPQKVENILLSTPDFESSDIVFDLTQSASRLSASRGDQQSDAWIGQLRNGDRSVRCRVTLMMHIAERP